MKIKHRSLTEVKGNEENIRALLFLTLGSKYLNLVHNVLNESIKSGNPHIIISDSLANGFFDDYFGKTKWSDFMIIEPVLFNFYHGLELTLKGLLLLTNNIDVKAIHSITDHFEKVNAIAEIPQGLKEVIKEHIVVDHDKNPLIFRFLSENKINIDQLYESLRYPADKGFNDLRTYFGLHYQEGNSLEYFKKMVADIVTLQRFGTSFYRDVTKTGLDFMSLE